MAKVDDSLVSYYQEEMQYLRNSGAEFAKNYPKIARRLELDANESPDPHVERLLESFAFLTARLSKTIDDRFPKTAHALLSILYPHLINPLPSVTIANLQVDSSQVPPDKGSVLPRDTKLLAKSLEGVQCGFKTVYNTELRPILVKSAELNAKEYFKFPKSVNASHCLSITISSKDIDFSKTDLDHLTFYLPESATSANAIYEALICENDGEIYLTTNNNITCIGGITISPMGFDRNELTLPMPEHSLHHYLLIQEYFHCIEKFFFIRFENLKQAIASLNAADKLQIVVPVKNPEKLLKSGVSAASFALNCVPVVNLFERVSDPLRIDHRHLKYRLIPDVRRERTTEIYSIREISGIEEGVQRNIDFLPYYNLENESTGNTGYWISQRQPAKLRGLPGSDIYLSFIDKSFNPIKSKDIVVTAKLLCTNRYLASQLTVGATLHPEDKAPVLKITLLQKPKQPVYSPEDGESLWMIISKLSGNYLSLLDKEKNLKVTRELLRVFASRHPEINPGVLQDLTGISVSNITRRFGSDAWRGFVQGLRINLEIKKDSAQSSNNLILSKILHHYFSAIVHWNSFIETQVIEPTSQIPWILWQPTAGQQIQL